MTKPTTLGILFVFCVITACDQDITDRASVASYKAEASAVVAAEDATSTMEMIDQEGVIFVDVREIDELMELGVVPGAIHVPRGVLEFYIDPDSSLHLDEFSSGKRFVFYCATGGRSLLAAKVGHDMGLPNVTYIEGGFSAWVEAGGDVTTYDAK
jgi:rhodanese-related sulfurtransferase